MGRIRDNERYELPPAAVRWTARRKAAVVLAVASGRLSIGEVQRRYNISVDEFEEWRRGARIKGLHVDQSLQGFPLAISPPWKSA
jgi:transposase-like protein